MYSYEKRKKAVDLFKQYDESFSAVKRELGYPNSKASLRSWVKEIEQYGDLHKEQRRSPKYSESQRKKAVEYYLSHGKNVLRTCKKLGYPSHTLLTEWILEDVPEENHNCRKSSPLVQCTQYEKEQAVIHMCTCPAPVQQMADELGVSRAAMYDWKQRLLRKGDEHSMAKKILKTESTSKETEELLSERAKLTDQVTELQKQIYRLQLEKDVLEKAAEVIKKDQGIILKKLTNREKAIVIDTLRDKYSLKELLSVFHMAKSSYCYQEVTFKAPDKYAEAREIIRKSFTDSNSSYGYRRIHLDVKAANITLSEKVIRRLMKEENLMVKSIKKKKYSSYMGEISPAVEEYRKKRFSCGKAEYEVAYRYHRVSYTCRKNISFTNH